MKSRICKLPLKYVAIVAQTDLDFQAYEEAQAELESVNFDEDMDVEP